MAFNPTKEQSQAITERGNVLVAAAAGSGKTAVLVERVIAMINNPQNPIDVNRLLIVTFTNAAAAEMRTRIEKRLAEECRKDPNNIRLLRQKQLIPSTKICTIDSFCIDLIRENFERCGVSPDFKIGDELSVKPLSDIVFTQLIGEYLSDENPVFRDLLDITGCEYDESNFIAVVDSIFKYSRQMPFPDAFLDKLVSFYNAEFNPSHQWFQYAVHYAYDVSCNMSQSIAKALDMSLETDYAEKYNSFLSCFAQQIYELRNSSQRGDWNAVYDIINGYIRQKAPSVRGANEIAEIIAIKEIYNDIDNEFASLKKLFFADFDTVAHQMTRLQKPISLLIEFIKEFSKRLFDLQCQENKFTFFNIEQLALNMLCEYVDDTVKIKDDARQFLSRFDEILVDEYQDTNNLQDMLFRVLSDNEEKLFTVGDVKQSIYAFRGANPNNFLNKKNNAVLVGGQPQENNAKKIILSKNFRSREGICEFINFFFRMFMNEDTGKIIYEDGEELVAGAEFPQYNNPETEILVIDNVNTPNFAEYNHLQIEAVRIAEYIKDVMNSGECIRKDKDTLRKAEYSDFAILMRNSHEKSAIIAEVLRSRGIPVTYSKENFLESNEIATFLSILDIIDNPDNDISLLTAMMSPIFAFTAEEMANIRAEKKQGSLVSAVVFFAQNEDKKVLSFLKKIELYRRNAMIYPLKKFISWLLDDTDYINIVSAMQDGARMKANLQLLISYASDFSKNNTSGLGGFLKYIHNLPVGSLSSAKTEGSGNRVRIMSMHASKGLQFPICILADTVTALHNKGSHSNYLYSENWGLGFRYFEETIGKKTDSLGYQILSLVQRQQRLEEELRLLYVAMTRAEEKLVIVISENNLEKKVSTLSAKLLTASGKVNNFVFSAASSMSDWILISTLLHRDGKTLRNLCGISQIFEDDSSRIDISVVNAEDLPMSLDTKDDSNFDEIDNELLSVIKSNIAYVYPYERLIGIEAKSTVSKLANSAESDRFAFFAKPEFLQKDGISAAGKGTATHKVMQFFDFSKSDDIDGEIERLAEWQFISQQEAEVVDRDALRKFFENPLFERLLKAKVCKREMRFLTEIPASKIENDLPENLASETVMVQGAVDLCFIEEDGMVIVDFKTDRVNDLKVLSETYAEQLNIYSYACEKIFDTKIKEKIIYSFALNDSINI